MPEFFLVDDGEAVAAAELLREVDIPAEDFHQPQDQPLGHAGGEAVLEQGRFDRAAGVCRPGFIQPWLLQDAEACVRALQVQGRVLARIRGELLQPAFVVCLQSQHLAGLDLMEQARLGVTADVLQQAGVVYPGTLQDLRQRFAPPHGDFRPRRFRRRCSLGRCLRAPCDARRRRAAMIVQAADRRDVEHLRRRGQNILETGRKRGLAWRHRGDGDRGHKARQSEQPHAMPDPVMAVGDVTVRAQAQPPFRVMLGQAIIPIK